MTALAQAELQRRATEYAATLAPGSEIHDFDQPTIEAFRHLLPETLARRGMRLVAVGCNCCDRAFQEDDCEEDESDVSVWRVECDAEPETVETPVLTTQQLHDLDPDNIFQGRNQ
jgi:hypothetical protein